MGPIRSRTSLTVDSVHAYPPLKGNSDVAQSFLTNVLGEPSGLISQGLDLLGITARHNYCLLSRDDVAISDAWRTTVKRLSAMKQYAEESRPSSKQFHQPPRNLSASPTKKSTPRAQTSKHGGWGAGRPRLFSKASSSRRLAKSGNCSSASHADAATDLHRPASSSQGL